MSGVSITSAPSRVNPCLGVPSGSSPAAPTAASLLPPPKTDVNSDDALAAFLILEGKSRQVGLKTAIKNINELRKQKHAEWAKQKRALMDAMKAKEHSGFWGKIGKACGTIGKIAAVVASVAIAVGTSGAGAPLVLAVAGVCLSSAALAQSEFGILQKLGVSDKAAGYIELGMAVASIGCSGGASLLKGAEAAHNFQKIMTASGRIVSIGSAVASGLQGVANIEKGQADGEAQDRYADVARAKLAESHLEQLLLAVLDELDNSEKEHRRIVSHVKGAIETRAAAMAIAAGKA